MLGGGITFVRSEFRVMHKPGLALERDGARDGGRLVTLRATNRPCETLLPSYTVLVCWQAPVLMPRAICAALRRWLRGGVFGFMRVPSGFTIPKPPQGLAAAGSLTRAHVASFIFVIGLAIGVRHR